jgi:peptide deformylase
MLKIVYYPDPILTTPTEKVIDFNAELEFLAEEMFNIMEQERGIGLSANQVGLNKSMFVMNCEGMAKVFINPTCFSITRECVSTEEGCLSFPKDFLVPVTRPKSITVNYQNIKGEKEGIHLTGLQSVCAQHEIDHLNGKTFLDKISSFKRSIFDNKLRKVKQ